MSANEYKANLRISWLMGIFREYDIRGIYGEDVNEAVFEQIGNAVGQMLARDIVVARDCRHSSKPLQDAFTRGVMQTDTNVMNIGMLPLPYAMHWAWSNMQELAYVTGSHLAKEWNGIKFFHHNGIGFSQEEQQKIKRLVEEKRFVKSVASVPIGVDLEDVVTPYHNHLASKIHAARPLRIVIDCGNSTAGVAVKQLFEKCGFAAELLFGEPDGNFPNHVPDPRDDPLDELSRRVKNADFGIAYDGDADRMYLMDQKGRKLTAEQTSVIMLQELLKEDTRPVVINVECSSIVDDTAKKFGREVHRIKVGHTYLVENTYKFNACFGVERSGHFVISKFSAFDDAIAASLYAAYVLSLGSRKLHELVDEMPQRHFGSVNFEYDDEKKFHAVERLKQKLSQQYSSANTVDGIHVGFDSGWILIRASNTAPLIRLSVEGKDEQSFKELKEKFSAIVRAEMKL